jgi:hypothetical protein
VHHVRADAFLRASTDSRPCPETRRSTAGGESASPSQPSVAQRHVVPHVGPYQRLRPSAKSPLRCDIGLEKECLGEPGAMCHPKTRLDSM